MTKDQPELNRTSHSFLATAKELAHPKIRPEAQSGPKPFYAGAGGKLLKVMPSMALTFAAEHKIQMIEAPKLARALYAHAELDSEIPMNLYTAVAQILAFVYQLRAGLEPEALGEIEIPAGLDPHEQTGL
jgi:flagellar biosynthetic protein FlhB